MCHRKKKKKNEQEEETERGKGRDGKTAQGNNSTNGVTVWIFSRSRNGDYDLAISVTRFY